MQSRTLIEFYNIQFSVFDILKHNENQHLCSGRLFYIFFLSFLCSFFFFYRVLSPYFILSYFYLKFKPRVFKQLWVAFRIFMWCEMYIIYVNVYIWKVFFLSSKKKKNQIAMKIASIRLSPGFLLSSSWWGGFLYFLFGAMHLIQF